MIFSLASANKENKRETATSLKDRLCSEQLDRVGNIFVHGCVCMRGSRRILGLHVKYFDLNPCTERRFIGGKAKRTSGMSD